VLNVTGLVAGYGPVPVLHGLDFEVPSSGITAILGSNGAGKTTTLSVLAGLVSATEGQVQLDGVDLGEMSTPQRVRAGLVLVPEGRHVFPSLSVEDNLNLGAWAARSRRQNIGEDLGKVYELFPRLVERRRQLAGTMSGGEQQMLAVGRGLMARPKVLMVDECSMGLAPVIISELFEQLERLGQDGMAVMAVEQNAEILNHCQRVYLMEQGTLTTMTLDGDVADITRQVQQAYLGTSEP
jgi:branched-chain amino acid transport system ATP-binding protein